MKKVVTLILALAMIDTALAGCGSDQSDRSSATESTTPPTDSSQPDSSDSVEQRHIDAALALIGSFASGDTSVAENTLTEGYIQHNLAYSTGRDAFIGLVAYLASAETKTTVKSIRALADGDYVFLQTLYNFAGAGDQVAFDIFRLRMTRLPSIGITLPLLPKPILPVIRRQMARWKLPTSIKLRKTASWWRISCTM